MRISDWSSDVFSSDLLTVDIEAISAHGGLLAALLDRPDLPGSNLKLVGSGPLADWSGDFILSLGDLATAQGERTSVGLGKSVLVSVDHAGSRMLNTITQ